MNPRQRRSAPPLPPLALDDDATASTPPLSTPPEAPPSDGDNLHKLLWTLWRASTDRETPTLNQLVQGGRIRRVDVDAASGYVAVVTDDDTHRAIGVKREWVAQLVAALTGRASDAVAQLLSKGPARLTPELPAVTR